MVTPSLHYSIVLAGGSNCRIFTWWKRQILVLSRNIPDIDQCLFQGLFKIVVHICAPAPQICTTILSTVPMCHQYNYLDSPRIYLECLTLGTPGKRV